MKAICIALVLIASVVAGSGRAADLDQSRLYNLKALKYLKSKSYDDAIREFQRAFYAAPSSKPLINIAKVYDEILKRKDLALDYYKMAIEHSETDRERDEISMTMAKLKGDLLQQSTLLQVRTPGVEADVSLKTAETGAPVTQCLSPCDLWVDNGAYILVATKKGFHYVERPVTVDAKGVMLVSFEMEPTSDRGAVNVTSNVDGASVLIGGQSVGATPFHGTFAPGRLAVRLDKPGYGAWNTVLDLAPGETQSVHVFLKTDEEIFMEGTRATAVPAIATPAAPAPASPVEPEAAVAAPPPAPPAAEEPAAAPAPPPVVCPAPIVCPAPPPAVCPAPVPCPAEACPPPPPPTIVEKEVRVGKGSVPRWLKWVFLGTGAGLAGGGVAMQVLGNKKMQEANDLPSGSANYQSRFFDLRDRGALFTNQAYLGYGLGGALVATGAVLWILEALERPSHASESLESPYRPSEPPSLPSIVPGGVLP